jgi:hypothetical protein
MTLGVVVALCLPATALAGNDLIFDGWVGTTGAYGPRHSLTSVDTSWHDGYNSCVNALEADGSGWAGASYCAGPGASYTSHPYCGCALRFGWGGAAAPDTWATTWQYW